MDIHLILAVFVTVVAGFMYASIFEWVLHRYVMHRPIGKFRYPFEAHTLTHHRIFKADYTYHLQDEGDKRKIRMAWWNGPVLVALGILPFIVGAASFIGSGWGVPVAICITGFVVSAGYYIAYEYLHWCMHLPKSRRLERSWIFFRLNGHHILHHRYMGKNFNVVFPLADALFGTLLLRAKCSFAQVRGSSVPDVQPLGAV